MTCYRLNYLIYILIFAVILSTFYIVHIHWQLPLYKLFTNYKNLSPNNMVQQLVILAQSGVAIMVGGLLALVSLLLQQIVRNNLASDSTLAIDSGAYLAIIIVAILFPNFALFGSILVAFLGAILSLGLVSVLSLPSGMNPYVLIISGMIASIFFGSLSNFLLIFNVEYSQAFVLWGSGHLYQVNWQPLQTLILVSAIAFVVIMVLHKPLTLIGLEDGQANRLGLSVNRIRLLVFILCAMLSAFVVSRVGIVSFVGLGAATLVNTMQIRDIRKRLVIGFVIGGLLLWLTNNLVNIISCMFSLPVILPAGSFTAILGVPLIIWLILKQSKQIKVEKAYDIAFHRKPINWMQYAIFMPSVFILAIVFVQNGYGWTYSFDVDYIFRFRLGRSIGAIATGMMLGCAGVMLQHMTRNPMASPEILGISSAASLSMVAAFMLIPSFNTSLIIGAGVVGSSAMLLLILWLSRKVNSTYLLLIGITVSACTSSVMTIILQSGDPKLEAVLNWLSGTTYHLYPEVSYILFGLALITVTLSFSLIKPLKLLSLGKPIAQSLGLSININNTLLLILVALLSTISSIAIGPLSFIGLIVPHIARSMGAVQIEKQLPLSLILGALIMLIADWLGRYIIFPYEIPVGILASLIGGAYFLVMMRKFK